MFNFSVREVVFISLFAAITVVLSVFPPLYVFGPSVPITAQSLGVMLAGGILGARMGAASMLLFSILVATGLPVLAGGRGGIGVFLGPTGGFVLGWIPAAYVVGLIIEKFWHRLNYFIAFAACLFGGVVVLYFIGIPWLAYVAKISLWKAGTICIGFIPGAIIKSIIATIIIVIVARVYPIIKSESK